MTSLSESERLDGVAEDRLHLPDRALFWRWVWASIRPVVGWTLAALGALALFLGWYGVSGQTLTAKQIPFLVSGGLVGVALIVMAGVFIATEDIRRQLARLDGVEHKLGELYGLFVEELAAAPTSRADADGGTLVALPSGTSYHRSSCALVAGKDTAESVAPGDAQRRGLRPCRVCEPPTG